MTKTEHFHLSLLITGGVDQLQAVDFHALHWAEAYYLVNTGIENMLENIVIGWGGRLFPS